jgi:hypothetical protein
VEPAITSAKLPAMADGARLPIVALWRQHTGHAKAPTPPPVLRN